MAKLMPKRRKPRRRLTSKAARALMDRFAADQNAIAAQNLQAYHAELVEYAERHRIDWRAQGGLTAAHRSRSAAAGAIDAAERFLETRAQRRAEDPRRGRFKVPAQDILAAFDRWRPRCKSDTAAAYEAASFETFRDQNGVAVKVSSNTILARVNERRSQARQ